ncbi:MAG: ADP-ribosylglycohydrolase family protein [Trueperaceae bacterium]|jgi:ADP-ribosylglycohydrolase/protein-tyrosine phosphatase
MAVRTSDTHPIEVFWVDPAAHGGAGMLGLTFAPGKKGAGMVTGARWERDLATDLQRLREHHGAHVLVSLMEAFEYDDLGVPSLLADAARRGLRVHHLPIVDGAVPTADQTEQVNALVQTVKESLQAGERVVVHCRGGQGRSGTVAALVLCAFGRSADEAVRLMRAAQPRAVENAGQHEYVREGARRLALNRKRGALLGLAVGDALGTTLEFRSPGTFEPLTDMVGGGPFGLKPGEWTDDTSMALCLAESLVEKRGFDPEDQMQRYVRWWQDGYFSVTGECFDIGVTTRAALQRFVNSGDPFAGSTDPGTAGNGSIMRLAPVPMAYAHDPAEAIRLAGESSRTTHGARTCVDACRYMAGIIVGAINGASKAELLAPMYTPSAGSWDAAPLAEEVAEVAGGSFHVKQPPAIRGSGYVVQSLEAALWAFANSASFEEGALMAVNLGDDADTTGAVYGQIAGAYYGASGIPAGWLEKIAMREEIEALAEKLVARIVP